MTTSVLKSSDLDLKTCLEIYKSEPFDLETFLNYRQECLNELLSKHQNDYLAIVTIVLRGTFADLLRQAFTIFSDKKEDLRLIFGFINRNLLIIVANLRSILKKSTFDRPQLTHLWHSTVLAGEALKPFSADFSAILGDIFADKMLEMIKITFTERLSTVKEIEHKEVIVLNEKYELNTTIVLNAVVDAVNQYRLCPPNEILKEKIISFIESNENEILTENIKSFAKEQL